MKIPRSWRGAVNISPPQTGLTRYAVIPKNSNAIPIQLKYK